MILYIGLFLSLSALFLGIILALILPKSYGRSHIEHPVQNKTGFFDVFMRIMKNRKFILVKYMERFFKMDIVYMKSGGFLSIPYEKFCLLYQLSSDIFIIFAGFLLFLSYDFINDFVKLACLWAILAYCPIIFFKIKASSRVREFESALPSLIDMIVLCIDSGMNFENALDYVIPRFKGILRKELEAVKKDMQYGMALEQVFKNWCARMDSIDLKNLTSVISNAKKLGSSISQVLSVQSDLMLTKRQQRAEELSRTASVKISIPLVFFIFPALLILYLAPAVLQFMK